MNDQELIGRLSAFVTDERNALFERLAPLRTRHVTAVLEDPYQPHNMSAVVRTCDLLGIQDVHVIERRNSYRVDPEIALGASKWVDVHRHGGSEEGRTKCFADLRAKGYRIVATSPRAEDVTPATIDIDRPLAICFGTEMDGLSDAAIEEADEHLRIPMYGFTESYNLSVSAAIVLYTVIERLRASGVDWRLDAQALASIKLGWLRASIRDAKAIESRLHAEGKDTSPA
ncbi:MAG: RNA methyltransferase [Flavobacteriales bacterium]|nr:RNA methyltransferase [Flavobacteriales bacterium]